MPKKTDNKKTTTPKPISNNNKSAPPKKRKASAPSVLAKAAATVIAVQTTNSATSPLLSPPAQVPQVTSVKRSGTKRLRSQHKQSEYRESSKSENKAKQHVSHIVDLNLVSHISQQAKGREKTPALKKVFNSPDNFYMVHQKTNLIEHKGIAKALMEKAESKKKLTKKEEKRARMQVDVLHQNKELLPKGFLNAAQRFYKKLETGDGKTLFDKRKFK